MHLARRNLLRIKPGTAMKPVSLVLLISAALLAAAGQMLFKIGATDRARLIEYLNPAIIVGLLCYALSTVAWIYTLSSEKLVNVYAFTALSFVLVYAGGVTLLGETLTGAGIVGIVLIMAGLFLLTTSNT
jgi:drug/metabolite transporter (DMT)-like permease